MPWQKQPMTELEKVTARRRARLRKLQGILGRPDGWMCDGEPRFFAGGRDCNCCGKICYNAFELVRVDGPAAGIKYYVGTRCAISALAYITGGLGGTRNE